MKAGESVPVWPPIAGTYAMRLTRDGVRVPVRIWFGLPVIAGEEQDRAPRWCVEIDGRTDRWERDTDTGYRCRVPIEVERAWPYCAREPIAEPEYRYLLEHAAWARDHNPEHPKAKPREAVNFHTLAPRF